MWADSHCHIPYENIPDGALDDARSVGVGRMVTIGTDAEQSASCVQLAREEVDVFAAVGLHPHDAVNGVATLDHLVSDASLFDKSAPLVVAIGECGLDYYYEHSPREVQMAAFAQQIALAKRLDVALVIHTRDAWDDTFDVLRGEGVPERTIIHCFSGGPDEARKCLDLGTWLSFSGIVTFKKAEEIRQAALLCPLERMLVETDSPFLAPVPYRGKPNRPALVTVVGEAIAQLRGMPPAIIEASTWAATAEVFALPA